jgi:uncharacterized protein (DUF302 family)
VAFFFWVPYVFPPNSRRLSMSSYGFSKKVNLTYEQLLDKLPDLLKKEGFGILTKIDVKETLKAKLNVDFPKYVILGVCNPPLAHQALLKEENIGLMLPCNIIVYEKNSETYISIIKPTVAMNAVDNPNLKEVALEAEARLAIVFDSIK